MGAVLPPTRATLAASLVLAAVLGTMAWLAASTTSSIPVMPPLAVSPPVRQALRHTASQKETDFAAMVDRPLFQPSRRPAKPVPVAVQAVASPPPSPAPTGNLVGVVIGPHRNLAILRYEGRSLVVSEGDAIAGWQVRRVDPDRVVLAHGDQTAEWRFAKHHDGEATMPAAMTHAPIRRRP